MPPILIKLAAAALLTFGAQGSMAPVLVSPTARSTVKNSMTVSYMLPQAAAAGSVTLTFTDATGKAIVLTMASEGERVGQHMFSAPPATPTSAKLVARGAPIPDGTYTVRLSYTAAPRGASYSATAAGVTVKSAP